MEWWNRFSLRVRFYVLLALLVLVTLVGGAITYRNAGEMQDLFEVMARRDVAALEAALELEISLIDQKGLVTYFALSSDPQWLVELEAKQTDFEQGLEGMTSTHDLSGEARAIVERIIADYADFVAIRNEIIALYEAGDRDQAEASHWDLRHRFTDIVSLCRGLKKLYEGRIASARSKSLERAGMLETYALTAMLSALILSGALAAIVTTQIIIPIRQLTRAATAPDDSLSKGHEVEALSNSVHGLIQDVDYTRGELERSQERLLQSERMAVVGKLAAEIAHSIRNPLTSIKMRLFSLEKARGVTTAQMEDLEVVSEEIRRLDNIVSNFLEFSRPPRLNIQRVDLAEIVTMSLLLLEKRLERHDIELERERPREPLPRIEADPELMKEVLINLLVNACDAMETGGTLVITEREEQADRLGRAVVVSVRDSGPGIPASIRDNVMQPFFSTKQEGTGLGLSIARRIVEEHGGRLEVRSEEGRGSTFVIALPVMEDER